MKKIPPRRCEICESYKKIKKAEGKCKLNPPLIIHTKKIESHWPPVSALEWCMQFVYDSTKEDKVRGDR